MLFAGFNNHGVAGLSDDPIARVPPVTEMIYGAERLRWEQQAASRDELATIQYLVYVDNSATEVQNVSCNPTPGPRYACTGQLPRMSAGQPHTLSISAYITR